MATIQTDYHKTLDTSSSDNLSHAAKMCGFSPDYSEQTRAQ